MSVAHALSVTDILNQVFEWYDYVTYFSWSGTNDALRTRTLAHAARVSRSFHDAAVRILWRYLRSMFPIFNLLPSLRKLEHNPDPSPRYPCDAYLLPKDVLAQEWDRVLKYGVHVRSIWLHEPPISGTKKLAPESWVAIGRFTREHLILPNLFCLHGVVELSRPTNMLHFLSPSVEMLTVTLDSTAKKPDPKTREQWAPHLEFLVREICKRNPKLTDLSFEIEDLSPSTIVQHLAPLPALLEFSVRSESGSVDLAHLRTLNPMVSLESLTLPSLSGAPSQNHFDPATSFRSLRTFQLKRAGPASEVFPCTTLKEFSIEEYTYHDEALFRQSCANWARAFPSLESFGCYICSEELADTEPRHPLSSGLAPMFALSSLTVVGVAYGTYVPINVTDADMKAMAEAWPSLKVLNANEISLGGDLPSCSVGLPGLLAVAKSCPQLNTLRFTRFVFRPEDEAELPQNTLDHGLQSLSVNYGMSEEAYRLIFEKIFPHMERKPGTGP